MDSIIITFYFIKNLSVFTENKSKPIKKNNPGGFIKNFSGENFKTF